MIFQADSMFFREIEDVISEHSAVSSVAVIGAPDEKWGEAVTAVVVLKPDTQCDPEELQALVRDRKGAIYTPKTIEFVDALPLTAVGKPDKKVIRANIGQQLTEASDTTSQRALRSPLALRAVSGKATCCCRTHHRDRGDSTNTNVKLPVASAMRPPICGEIYLSDAERKCCCSECRAVGTAIGVGTMCPVMRAGPRKMQGQYRGMQ